MAWHSISNSVFLLQCFGTYLAGNFLKFSNPASSALMTWFIFYHVGNAVLLPLCTFTSHFIYLFDILTLCCAALC